MVEIIKPCLLCKSDLLVSDWEGFNFHIEKNHSAIKGGAELWILFQISAKIGTVKTFEVLCELNESFNIETEKVTNVKIESSDYLEIKMEDEEDSIPLNGNNTAPIKSEVDKDVDTTQNVVIAHLRCKVEAVDESDPLESPSASKKSTPRYSAEQREFCVEACSQLGSGAGWHQRFTRIFQQRFPNSHQVPSKWGIQKMKEKFDKYHTYEARNAGNSGKKIKSLSTICEECGFVAECRKKLRIHKRIHQRKNCPECGKLTGNLPLHLQSHLPESEKRFKCSQCGKGCSSKANLQEHISSIHSDERPFVCQYLCGHACKSSGNLRKHERTCKYN